MIDNAKTTEEEKTEVYETIAKHYIKYLLSKIGAAKMARCLNEKGFSSLTNDDLLSVKEVSEFLSNASIKTQDALESLMAKDILSAHVLVSAYILCKELKKRGLLEDKLGQLKNGVDEHK